MQTQVFNQVELDPQTRAFYCQLMDVLSKSQIPFLVGGGYAFERYTEIARHTKDLDLFVRPNDCLPALELLSKNGYDTELALSHWLGKVCCGDDFVDLIFNSANGMGEVDDRWFEYAIEDEVLGMPVLLCPPEEIICSKAFVMARDRFDGPDVAHLIRACSDRLDWPRLLERFGSHWRVLLSHVILFGFIYPGERSHIPDWVMDELFQRLQDERSSTPPDTKLCQGTLLSPLQYQVDVDQWGYQDARLSPKGNMTAAQISQWTEHLKKNA